MQSKQQGFSMLEVLITILIVSFGLLALAGLQMYGIKSNRTSYYRSIATMQADDFVERLRANRAYISKSTSNAQSYQLSNTATPTAPSCASTGCTAAQIAQKDLYDWHQTFVGASGVEPILPSGKGTVSYDSASGLYDISVEWKDNPEETNLQKFSTKARP